VDADPLAAPAAVVIRDRDVDGAAKGSQESPVNGGRAMAEHSAGTASEDRRHPVRLVSQAVVAQGVDALMDAMKAATTHALGNGRSRQPRFGELHRSHDPVLHTRDVR
jgi:hypothetical protein